MARDVAGLFFLVLVSSAAQEILEPPKNTIVFPNEQAVFTCEVTRGHVSWNVNGKPRTELSPELLNDLLVDVSTSEDGNPLVILTITARDEYNGTTVQCLVNVGFSDESENVSLRIQGLPPEVGDLTATSDGTSVTVSWSPPFSLIPDIWYSVFIYNVTDENNPTAILCTNCTNITETHYTFTPDYLSPCHVYNFSVVPLNGAGQGESSGHVTNELQFPEVEVEAMTNDEYRKVTFSTVQFKDVPTVSVYNAADDFNGTNGTVFTLPADGEYNATVGYPMFCGGEKIKNFTTYDVQEPHAEPISNEGGEIMVTGKLIPNSSAEGCFLVVQCNYSTEITFFALNRNGRSRNLNRTIPMPPSNYTVYAHDLEKDGLPNMRPANLIPSIVEIIHGVEKSRNGDDPKNASISRNGLTVEIKCDPEEQRASCILVFRAYGNSILYCVETFPATVPLDPNRNYTFALFKRLNNSTEERPFFTKFVQGKEDTRPQPSLISLSDDKPAAVTSPSGAVIAGVLVSAFIVAVVGAGAGAAVIVFVVWRKHRKSYNTDGTKYPPEEIPHSDTHRSFTRTECVEINLDGEDRRGSEVSAGSTSPLVNNEVAEKQQKEEANTYATVVVSTSGVLLPLTEDSRVEYVGLDIRATHKMARSPYAELGPLPTRSKPPKMKTKTEGPYVGIQPHSATPVTHNAKRNVAKTPPKGPPTIEAVMTLLWGVAGRWKEMAFGLGFDEDHIEDEIGTNNSTDEARLQDCVEQWISRLQPSWEKLSHVLRDMGVHHLAQKAWNEVPESTPQSSQCSDGVHGYSEVVPGVKGKAPRTTDNNEGTREGKKLMLDDCTKDEQDTKPTFQLSPTPSEENPVIRDGDENENTLFGQSCTESEDEVTAASIFNNGPCCMAGGFNEDACVVGVNLNAFSLGLGDIPPSFTEDAVDVQQSDDIYHCICEIKKTSVPGSKLLEVQGRDFVMGGTAVVPQECSDFSGFDRAERQDTPTQTEATSNSDENLPGFTYLLGMKEMRALPTNDGELVIGLPYKNPYDAFPDPFYTHLSEPTPEPEETSTLQQLPPEPTPPHSEPVETPDPHPQGSSPQQSPLFLMLEECVEKVTAPFRQTEFLDPPENFQAKMVKWMHCGASLGFHGPNPPLDFGGSPIKG